MPSTQISVLFSIQGPINVFLNDSSNVTWEVSVSDTGELFQTPVAAQSVTPILLNGPSALVTWQLGINTDGRLKVTAIPLVQNVPAFVQLESINFVVWNLVVDDSGSLSTQVGTLIVAPPPPTPTGTATYAASRYPAMARVEYPLIPPPPAGWTVDLPSPHSPRFYFELPSNIRDIYGILIQSYAARVSSIPGPDNITLVSSNPNDTRQLLVVGQDVNFAYMEEVVTLTGTAPVVTKKRFYYLLWVNNYYGTILNEVPTPFPDGIRSVFVTSQQPIAGSLTVLLNGLTQVVGVDYNPAGQIITFINPPTAGSQIQVSYIYSEFSSSATVRIYNAGLINGALAPNALQWQAAPLLYRYEDLSFGGSVGDPALYFTYVGLAYGSFNVYFYNILDELSKPLIVNFAEPAALPPPPPPPVIPPPVVGQPPPPVVHPPPVQPPVRSGGSGTPTGPAGGGINGPGARPPIGKFSPL